MLTDKHIEVISPDHCYACSKHTGTIWIIYKHFSGLEIKFQKYKTFKDL